jgi:hypothetical protein
MILESVAVSFKSEQWPSTSPSLTEHLSEDWYAEVDEKLTEQNNHFKHGAMLA